VRTLKLTLAYDGTPYVGWQRQPTGPSVQALLEDSLAPLEKGQHVPVAGAGRTDAGVHALGQVASCRIRSTLDTASYLRALNARLPLDIRVLDVAEAPRGFHARFWASGKTYAYFVLQAPVADPLAARYVWHLPQALDLDAMRFALRTVVGTHDFKGFQASGTRVTATVRTVRTATLEARPWVGPWGVTGCGVPSDGTLVRFELEGDGFLRHMVRNIVGTIVEVGVGRRDAGDLARVLSRRDRRQAGVTAPARGLILLEVRHADGPVARPTVAE
jgi:tRNA pseudouridine38-40 synthase